MHWKTTLIISILCVSSSFAQDIDSLLFRGLKYRNVGPTRGGRATAVAGVSSDPSTYYMGSTGGGVWKSTDYGQSWKNISDGYFATPSIGAIRVSESNPDIIYVGTGSDGIRSNVITGKGVYKSSDAGNSWEFIGLKNAGDTLYFIHFLKYFYKSSNSLENAFITGVDLYATNIEAGLRNFHNLFFSLPDAPIRTRKHISTPLSKSACKRLNMFLRWMVRNDNKGVDFGIWKKIKPSQLVCPCDIHVDRVARGLGLINRKQTDWQTALELTENLKRFDPDDPVKYDFALFGLGVEEKFY